MRIRVLTIPGCPHAAVAAQRVRLALREQGLEQVEIQERILGAGEELAALSFAGSPTILLDGVDLEPDARPVSEPSCRVYRTDDGVDGSPSVAQISRVIAQRLRPAR